MRALSIAATGMLAQQTNVEVIANNLANMNTTGYKRQRAEFQDLLYQNVEQPGAQSSDSGTVLPTGIQLGAGVRTAAVYRIIEPGRSAVRPPIPTISRSRARAISTSQHAGRHRRLYARGQFRAVAGRPDRHRQGLYRGAGHRRAGQRDSASPSTRRARCRRRIPGQTAPQTLGQLELVRFPNEAGLSAQGDNLFTETPSSGSPQAGVPGLDRLRHDPAGLSRNLQRQSGGRDHFADHRPARL